MLNFLFQGISLWLNKGSTIRMRWEAQASSISQLEGIVIKGYFRRKPHGSIIYLYFLYEQNVLFQLESQIYLMKDQLLFHRGQEI